MKFKIYSRLPNGKEIFHIYDNITQDIFTSKGIPTLLNRDPRCSNLLITGSKKTSFIKDNSDVYAQHKQINLSDLRITLGFNCNFSCKYCSQHKTRVVNETPTIVIHEDLEHKVNKLVNQLKSSKLNPKHITFWGGEPLVYIKTIKLLIPELRKIFPKTKFGTITNGSLLNLNLVKYFLENKVSLTVSHDGPSFNVYRDNENPLNNKKVLEAIDFYEKNCKKHKLDFSFNCVVTPENSNLEEIDKYFKSYFGRSIKFNFESIAKLDSHSKDIINPFTQNTTKVLLDNIFKYGTTEDNTHPYWSIRDKVTMTMKHLVSKTNMLTRPSYCNIASKDFIAIDMQGNLLECHGFSESYGKLSDIKNAVFKIRHPWTTRKDCPNCPYLVSCGGGCVMVSNEDAEIACKNLQIWHAGFFVAAWKLLFNSTIFKIEPLGESYDDSN